MTVFKKGWFLILILILILKNMTFYKKDDFNINLNLKNMTIFIKGIIFYINLNFKNRTVL